MADQLAITAGERLEVIEDNAEVLTVVASYAPRGTRPPPHYHPRQDEHFEVLDGNLRVQVAGVERDLHAGDTLDIHRGTAHCMWNPTDRAARLRWETRPAGNTKAWFTALAALQGTRHVDQHGRPTPLAFAALAHAHRDTVRLALGSDSIERLVVGAAAALAHATGRAPNASRDFAPWSGPLAGVAFIGGVAAGIAIADTPYPRPGATPAAIRGYFHDNARAARVSITGQLCSAAALARFAATVANLARQADTDHANTDADPLAAAARVAGAAATGSLAASALQSLALTRGGQSDATAVALHRRVFLTGGPVHTAAFGALVGCLSLAGRRTAQLPDRLTGFGLLAATTGMLSPLSLIIKPAVWLIPAGRMSGLAVTAVAGAILGRSRRPRPPAAQRGGI
jgi:Cupin domain